MKFREYLDFYFISSNRPSIPISIPIKKDVDRQAYPKYSRVGHYEEEKCTITKFHQRHDMSSDLNIKPSSVLWKSSADLFI